LFVIIMVVEEWEWEVMVDEDRGWVDTEEGMGAEDMAGGEVGAADN